MGKDRIEQEPSKDVENELTHELKKGFKGNNKKPRKEEK